MTRNCKKGRGAPGGAPPQTAQPRNEYWHQFPGFVPNPRAGIGKEFKRLAKSQGWKHDEDPEHYAKEKSKAYDAEFNFHFTKDKTTLEAWQALCREVSIDPAPESITKCKKALQSMLVNIVNLMDRRRNPSTPLKHFANYREFRAYTRAPNHMYPKESAKKEGYIRELLRIVL